jgi:3'-phosphoadenosine 5'-phosphosulfate sulfotransferase (PAPS reductase)/FAD synthetase
VAVIAVWFSCGAASAVALKLTVQLFGKVNVRAINNPIAEENPDNLRFAQDVSKWVGIEIEYATHPDFPSGSARDVWEKRRFMSHPKGGAPCTTLLKKHARQYWENKNQCDWHVFGFTSDEMKRHERFIMTERENVIPVLIWANATKDDCARVLTTAGIKLPESYRLGYPNANCIGCVKATSATYWNLVRKTNPEVFADRAEQSRRLGAKLARVKGTRVYLDELPINAKGRPLKSMPDCGTICEEWS